MESNVRKVQNVQLQILMDYMAFCKEHHLRYFVSGGSLIGVMRHKGFIPWDDDIDVMMPRSDYNQFVKLQSEFPKDYFLVNHDTDKNWQFNFAQFVDNQSEIIVRMNEEPRKCKIWIDVFPLDGMPNNSLLRWFHIKHILMYRYLIQIPNIRTQVDTHKVGRPFYEKCVIKLLHYIPMGKFINVNSVLKKMEKALEKYDYDKSGYVGNMLGKYREREIVPYEYFGHGKDLDFENIKVCCPDEPDKLLKHLYGEYMQLPPEKDRVSHDIEIIRLRGEK